MNMNENPVTTNIQHILAAAQMLAEIPGLDLQKVSTEIRASYIEDGDGPHAKLAIFGHDDARAAPVLGHLLPLDAAVTYQKIGYFATLEFDLPEAHVTFFLHDGVDLGPLVEAELQKAAAIVNGRENKA